MPPWDLITNQFFRLICICAQFLPLYFICRFFFSFSFPFFDILRIGTRDYKMYKISDCHLSFVLAAVTIECFMFWNSWNKISCLLSAIQVHV